MEEKTLNQMDAMPPKQQENLMGFWNGFQRFFTDFVGWIPRAWCKVLEKIIQVIWEAAKTLVTGLFKGIGKAFSLLNPFNWFK